MREIRTQVVEVGEALLHVRRLGDERSAEPPVLLIHGATVEGDTDWGIIAPILARARHVIVPDCRGHGRSTNPSGGYAFAQLAADAAAIVRALGYGSAHIVGHSNGGNVALVMMIEHPQVVASCVVQAANAYVSDSLRRLEPAKFDPERVDAEDPAWRDRMIALHGAVHGADYWRTLLRWTGTEIVSAPNYDAQALERVARPTLVIEGADDDVNAESGHGSFIARNVPSAELWRPQTGHHVQLDRPLDWIARVEDFWSRRGTPARDALWRLQRGVDQRSTVLEVTLSRGDPPCLTGTVLDAEALTTVRAAVASWPVSDGLSVLADDASAARLIAPLADVHAAPADEAECVSQVLYGEPLRRFDRTGRWTRVRVEHDGYLGWTRSAMLVDSDAAAHADDAMAAIIRADVALVHGSPDGPVIARLPFGARVQVQQVVDDWVGVGGPTDASWWLRRGAIATGASSATSVTAAVERFVQFVGVPYLWGGRTPYGFDCSGLSQAFWAMLGTPIGRDADQQAASGAVVTGMRRAGDLVFFQEPASDSDAIVHVGIAIDADRYLHAWGVAGMTTVSSLHARSDAYAPTLSKGYLGARHYEPTSPPARTVAWSA